MDPFRMAFGSAGLVGLTEVCTKGYAMLTNARSVASPTEGIKMQHQDGDLSVLLQPDSRKYVLIVEVLAKIVDCFRKIHELDSTYKANRSTVEFSVVPGGPGKL
ncbi:hypothetical protein RUND412_011430 [Rhizina undulata]